MTATHTDAAVTDASDRFYDALERMANGDAEPMSAVWSHGDDVTTMHPIGGREVGWDAVANSWASVAELATDGRVTRGDQLVRVVGDLAYELVTERVDMTLGGESIDAEYRATNVYRREDGEWRVVHHHADLDEEFVDIVQRLAGGE
ncbi:YybH family protein [Haloarchaeobius baliensis]|uniref:YybH family protein n=1 Tax=Haloarchaeobius baliensis TaxID=1670458 RepID=UPI003F8840F9